MTTVRQAASNRANATKSTGPKSVTGKHRSAINAKRHGMRGRPDADQVLAWFRVILDDPDALINDVMFDPAQRTAMELAEAEVRLANVRREEERLLVESANNNQGNLPRAARLLRRYRGQAESHRARALKHWLDLWDE